MKKNGDEKGGDEAACESDYQERNIPDIFHPDLNTHNICQSKHLKGKTRAVCP